MSEKKEMSIEEMLEELDNICNMLEEGDLSIEDAFKTYEKGMKLVKKASEKVDDVEKKIQIISEEGQIE